MNKLLFTDLQLLETIQKEYANIYLKNMNDYKNGKSDATFYTPIDCYKIADIMKVDTDMVFNRLYYHLNEKYSYKKDDNSKVLFFAWEINGQKHCINYPYLCSVLVNMKEQQKKENLNFWLAIIGIIISIIALFIEIF